MLIVLLLVLLFAGTADAYLIATGTYSGNSTAQFVNLPFDVTTGGVVLVKCDANQNPVIRFSTNTGTGSFFLGTNGSTISNGIDELASAGFSVSSSSAVNGSGTSNCFFLALANDANNDLYVGTYSGSGASQDVTALGFQPALLLIRGANASASGVFRTGSMATDSAAYWRNVANATGLITALLSTGFTVAGTDVDANASGTTYHVLAIKANAVGVQTSSFTGSGSARTENTSIVPRWIITKGDNTQYAALWTDQMIGGSFTTCGPTILDSLYYTAVTSSSFSLSTNACVNANAVAYNWFAVGTPGYGSLRRRGRPMVMQ